MTSERAHSIIAHYMLQPPEVSGPTTSATASTDTGTCKLESQRLIVNQIFLYFSVRCRG